MEKQQRPGRKPWERAMQLNRPCRAAASHCDNWFCFASIGNARQDKATGFKRWKREAAEPRIEAAKQTRTMDWIAKAIKPWKGGAGFCIALPGLYIIPNISQGLRPLGFAAWPFRAISGTAALSGTNIFWLDAQTCRISLARPYGLNYFKKPSFATETNVPWSAAASCSRFDMAFSSKMKLARPRVLIAMAAAE
jgi:hypothetical protein